MKSKSGRRHCAALLLGSLLGLSTQVFAQTADFCWSATTVRPIGTVPSACGPDQERNGALCYPRCLPGYVSDGVAGCLQGCPAGSTNDGLFCGWPSYKAAEYPAWDESRCRASHPTGCWQTVPVIGVWVEHCRPGYRHVAGFCELADLNCTALGFAGNRIANSCPKRHYLRPPALASCSSGQEYDAGLCYSICPNGAEGIGPICRGVGPAGWVPCGGGWAKDAAACSLHKSQLVLSVADAAMSATTLIASIGMQKPAPIGTTTSTPVIDKAAWEELKKIGAVQTKEMLVSASQNTATAGVAIDPTALQSTAAGVVEQIWKIGALEHDSPTKTLADREREIAKIAQTAPPTLDPAGVGGTIARFQKTSCGGFAPSSAVHELMKRRAELEQNYLRQKAAAEAARKAAADRAATLQAAYDKATLAGKTELQASLTLAQQQQQLTSTELQQVTVALGQFGAVAPKWDALAAATTSGDVKTSTSAAPVLSWGETTWKAYDIAAGANGAVWFISAATQNGSDGGIWRVTTSGPQQVAGGAMRIAVDPAGNPWVVNSGNQIFRWNGSGWQLMPGAARDIGIGANGAVWVIGTDMSPYRWTGSTWSKISGGAVLISVDPSGNPWVVNAGNQIWRYDGANWTLLPGAARDVGVGADGNVYVVGMGATAGGSQVYRWVPSANNWTPENGVVGFSVAAGPSGTVYVARSRDSGMNVLARIPR